MVYLQLYHGRDTAEEQLDDWGFEGPILGPFPFVHTTYASDVKFGDDRGATLSIIDGLVRYDGKFYGDWSVCDDEAVRAFSQKQLARVHKLERERC